MTAKPELTVGTLLVERFGWDGMALTKIVRVTKSQAITARGTRYRLSDHKQVGDYGTARIATAADIEEMEVRQLVRKVTDALPSREQLKRMPREKLVALLAILAPENTNAD